MSGDKVAEYINSISFQWTMQKNLSYIMGLYQQYIKKFPEDQTYKESARFF